MSSAESMNDVLAVVLAGGVGERLYPLTRNDAKPAVPFGGMYRIIDFTLSNCVNSHVRKVLVLVQYKSLSLSRHIRGGWNITHPEWDEFVEVIPAQKRVGENWYLGTADAIYQNLYSIESEHPQEVLVLSGDHIYKMNYGKMVAFHRRVGADMTVAAIETPLAEASRFGVLEIDTDTRVIGFEEKPANPHSVPNNPGAALASMGIYVFNRSALMDVVAEDAKRRSSHDFGKDIIPQMIKDRRVFAYMFQDENKKVARYWRDVGTLDSYWEANMDLITVDPVFNLYDKDWPIRTRFSSSPPAKFVFGDQGVRFGVAVDSIVSPGCILSGGMVRRCVLSPDVRINSYSYAEDSLFMQGVTIGRHTRLKKVIVEAGVTIPEGAVIGYNPEEDAKRFHVTEKGVVVIAADTNGHSNGNSNPE